VLSLAARREERHPSRAAARIGAPGAATSMRRAEDESTPSPHGTASAAAEVLVPHLDAAYDLARWLTRDPTRAEDLVQTACLHAVRGFAGYRGGSARSWLLRIVRNAFYDALDAARRRDVELSLDEEGAIGREPRDPTDPELEMLRRADRAALSAAFAALSLPLREVLVLRELEGLSYREIAAVCDLPMGTVMSRLSRARQAVQEHILRAGGGSNVGRDR